MYGQLLGQALFTKGIRFVNNWGRNKLHPDSVHSFLQLYENIVPLARIIGLTAIKSSCAAVEIVFANPQSTLLLGQAHGVEWQLGKALRMRRGRLIG